MTEAAFDACILAILNGDKQGLRDIYDCYLDYIYRIVYGVVGRKEDAEDITSEFFIKLWQQADKYRRGSGHKAYLATIARNMAIDHMRKYKREILEEFPEEVEAAFIDDMYMKTLFTYIAVTPGAKRKKSFLEMLQNAILDCFPEFETNPYYYEKYDDDIKDLVSLHIESPGKFLKTVKNFDSLEIE